MEERGEFVFALLRLCISTQA